MSTNTWSCLHLKEMVKIHFAGARYNGLTDKVYTAGLPLKFFMKSKPWFAWVPRYEADVFDCDNFATLLKSWIDRKGYKLKAPPIALLISYKSRAHGCHHRAIICHCADGWRLIDWSDRDQRIQTRPLSDILKIRRIWD